MKGVPVMKRSNRSFDTGTQRHVQVSIRLATQCRCVATPTVGAAARTALSIDGSGQLRMKQQHHQAGHNLGASVDCAGSLRMSYRRRYWSAAS